VAFLSILLLLFSFVFLGVGHGSSSTTSLPIEGTSSTSTGCVVVTWRKGQPAHKRACHGAASGSGSVHARPVVKCSARMTADGQTRQRCGPPPANP
jgi:hypothetical protein